MRRRLLGPGDFGAVREWWKSVPFVTKVLATQWIICAVSLQFGLASLDFIRLDARRIFKKFEIWRLISNVGFLGGFSPNTVIRFLWLFIYSPVVERIMTEYNPGEYAYYILLAILTIDLIGMTVPFVKIMFCSSPLVFSIMYLWSREFAQQDVPFYGLVNIKAFYLPWVMLAVGIMFGASAQSTMIDLTGIAVGHLYYFFKTIYPSITGRILLKCPVWMSRLMAPFYKKHRPETQQSGNQGRESSGGFRAFSGTARRLRD